MNAPASPITLAIEDLTVSFDGFKAVDGVNLYVERNELRVIIGPNGAGKTTPVWGANSRRLRSTTT